MYKVLVHKSASALYHGCIAGQEGGQAVLRGAALPLKVSGGQVSRKAVNTKAPSQRQAPTPKRAAVRLLGCFAASSAHHSVPVASGAVPRKKHVVQGCHLITQGTATDLL